MKRLLGRRPTPEAKPGDDREPIPQRWVIILLASALGGGAAGSAAEPFPWGITTAVAIIGLLHAVMR
jgi:CHASE2 domain-containing sensor protein